MHVSLLCLIADTLPYIASISAYIHACVHAHPQVGTISPDQFYADLLRAVDVDPTDVNVAAVHSAQMEYLARFTSDVGRTEQITSLLKRIRASGCVSAWHLFWACSVANSEFCRGLCW